MTKRINPDAYSGYKRVVFLILPFIQLILCLNSLEPFLFWGLHRFVIDFIILIILCIAAIFLLRIYFAIAKKWQKWVMYFFFILIGLQMGIGFMYKFYTPPKEYFKEEDMFAIQNYILKKDSLPAKYDILLFNDNITVFGKKTNIRAYDYGLRGNPPATARAMSLS